MTSLGLGFFVKAFNILALLLSFSPLLSFDVFSCTKVLLVLSILANAPSLSGTRSCGGADIIKSCGAPPCMECGTES